MKQIKFLSEDITVQFNMAVQISYEEIADKPFSLPDLVSTKSRLALYYATIITNNPKTNITIEDLLQKATREDIGALDTALNEEMQAWYKIPSTEPVETQAKDEEGESPNL